MATLTSVYEEGHNPSFGSPMSFQSSSHSSPYLASNENSPSINLTSTQNSPCISGGLNGSEPLMRRASSLSVDPNRGLFEATQFPGLVPPPSLGLTTATPVNISKNQPKLGVQEPLRQQVPQIPLLGEVIRSDPCHCQECKECQICRAKGDDSKMLFCDQCDRGWHYDCLAPPLNCAPRGKWSCPMCQAGKPSPHSQTPSSNAPKQLARTRIWPRELGSDKSSARHNLSLSKGQGRGEKAALPNRSKYHSYTRPSDQCPSGPVLKTDSVPVGIEGRDGSVPLGEIDTRAEQAIHVGVQPHPPFRISSPNYNNTSFNDPVNLANTPQEGQVTKQIISHKMPLVTIIKHLVNHGCSDVTLRLENTDEYPKYSGSLSDVYQARWSEGGLVAVKCLRTLSNSGMPPGKDLKRTARELYTWSRASHPNILKLHGLAVVRERLAMIAPWMEYCSLLAYLRARPQVDRCGLCGQVASGLSYMHSLGLAHGDIKGDNIVVSADGTAKITDFGSATMVREFAVAFTATQTVNFSVRWAAPELFRSQCPGPESDVYAYAKTVLEALTGDIPHTGLSDMAIMMSVGLEGKLPDRPMGLIPPQSKKGDMLWTMLARCWDMEPARRPIMNEVWEFMNDVTQEDLQVL